MMLWFILYTIPFRAFVLIVGLSIYLVALKKYYHQYTAARTKHHSKSSFQKKEVSKKVSAFSIWISNLFRSLPIDDDLQKTYFWEIRSTVARQLRLEAEERRSSRLKKLWRAQWYEVVQILQSDFEKRNEKGFAVIQGRRFIWWSSTEAFDTGEQPAGTIFLHGHAGLATPSPIELKAIGDDIDQAVTIFGRGSDRQKRITMLVPNTQSKDAFEKAVEIALWTKED